MALRGERPGRSAPGAIRSNRRSFMKTALGIFALAAAALAQPPAGLWDAAITVNKVEIPFRFELSVNGQGVRGAFFNGDDKVPSTLGSFENGTLTLQFDQYA